MDATTGLPRLRALATSRQMVSDAESEPPGLSTRSTIADTASSAAASRRAAAIVSPPTAGVPNGRNCGPPRPLTIWPATVTNANVGLGRRPGTGGRGGVSRDWAAPAYRDR